MTLPFLLSVEAGAALLALWVIARFPEWGPAGLPGALLRFSISLPFVWMSGNLTEPLAAHGPLQELTALFLLVLALVYSWSAVAWLLRSFHKATTC